MTPTSSSALPPGPPPPPAAPPAASQPSSSGPPSPPPASPEATVQSGALLAPLSAATRAVHGTPRVMNSPYPLQIIQTKGKTTIVHEVNHNVRHIYMDEPLPASVTPSFLGTSAGHWEGDTLVVETRGVDDRTWIDEVGIIHGKQMKVTERIRKIEAKALRTLRHTTRAKVLKPFSEG